MCSSLETESAPSTPRTHCSAADGPFSCATSPEPESDEYDEWSSELSDALSYTSYSSYSSESSSASSSSSWSYASSLASVQVSDGASEDVDPSGPSGETGLSPRVVGIDLCEVSHFTGYVARASTQFVSCSLAPALFVYCIASRSPACVQTQRDCGCVHVHSSHPRHQSCHDKTNGLVLTSNNRGPHPPWASLKTTTTRHSCRE
jgi:hypothetical protein